MTTVSLAVGLILSTARAAAPQDCSGAQVPLFVEASNTLCLPSVDVLSSDGLTHYHAELKLEQNENGRRFILAKWGDPLPGGTGNVPVLNLTSGLLQLDLVELRKDFGLERYRATLSLQTVPGALSFGLDALEGIISPAYQAGVTWKPYTGLLLEEKNAVNILARAQPYTYLAEAVYDFEQKQVGDWHLVQQRSTNHGMQAAAYLNDSTQELVIAYRGTDELCLVPFVCSSSEIVESTRDSLTDTLLTQGRDSGQFDEAYNFARDLFVIYPRNNITVTGHSLGGGLAQAVGASFLLTTYAFNASPVPHNFYDEHGVKQFNDAYSQFIHVISDVHDPVSNTDYLGVLYADASHVTPVLKFDFDKKEILPTYKAKLDDSRFNKHSITKLKENIDSLVEIYRNGW